METLLSELKAHNLQNRTVAVIENGTWAPTSGKLLKAEFDTLKNCEYIGDTLTIKSASFSAEALDALADAVAASLQ